MCGIAGIAGRRDPTAAAAVRRMCDAMVARGPDDEGLELLGEDSPRAVVLGSRRLAIIDPRPAGHQPMRDPHRGNVIAFNGMLFNFRELRHALVNLGERFASECDTEVVLRAYGHWGPTCLERFEGMFAFAVWDAARRITFVARDPLGIKPLYWTRAADSVLFASQVRPLLASGFVEPTLDVAGVESFLRWGATIEPRTCLKDVSSLPAGTR